MKSLPHKRPVVVGVLAIVVITAAWLIQWSCVEVAPIAASGVMASEARNPADTRVIGDAIPVERSVVVGLPTHSEKDDPDVIADTFRVKCQVLGVGSPISGIEVLGLDATDLSLVGVPVVTNHEGMATVRLPKPVDGHPGHLVQARDHLKRWMHTGSDGAVPSKRPGFDSNAVVVMEFVEVYVADFEFTGDDVLAMSLGSSSRLQHSSNPSGGPRHPSKSDAGYLSLSYRFCFEPPKVPPSTPPTLKVTAYGRRHGECVFAVPIVPASTSVTPVQCDLATFPLRLATEVMVEVTDQTGARTDIGNITFSRVGQPYWRVVSRANVQAWLPSGFEYSVKIGDFPIVWSSPQLKTLDCRGNAVGPVLRRLELNCIMAPRNITFSIDGIAIAGYNLWCMVHNQYGDPSGVSGAGVQTFLIKEARLEAQCLPSGTLDMTLYTTTHSWRVQLPVAQASQDLVVDLKMADAKPIQPR